jgi:hypothetical protein
VRNPSGQATAVGTRAGGSQGPVAKSRRRASMRVMPHFAAVHRQDWTTANPATPAGSAGTRPTPAAAHRRVRRRARPVLAIAERHRETGPQSQDHAAVPGQAAGPVRASFPGPVIGPALPGRARAATPAHRQRNPPEFIRAGNGPATPTGTGHAHRGRPRRRAGVGKQATHGPGPQPAAGIGLRQTPRTRTPRGPPQRQTAARPARQKQNPPRQPRQPHPGPVHQQAPPKHPPADPLRRPRASRQSSPALSTPPPRHRPDTPQARRPQIRPRPAARAPGQPATPHPPHPRHPRHQCRQRPKTQDHPTAADHRAGPTPHRPRQTRPRTRPGTRPCRQAARRPRGHAATRPGGRAGVRACGRAGVRAGPRPRVGGAGPCVLRRLLSTSGGSARRTRRRWGCRRWSPCRTAPT